MEENKMSKKRVAYQNLLKQAIAEYDTSQHLQVKGPMLDPIIGWSGDGELPTYKDAASVLERYYYNQDTDKGVEVLEADMENDKGEDGSGMKHGEGAGTEQAGTDDSKTIGASLDSKEKMIAKEQDEPPKPETGDEKEEEAGEEEAPAEKEEEVEESEAVAEDEMNDKDVPPAKKYDEENMTTEDIENAVIEKLIAEMEEEDEPEEKDEKEEEGEEVEEAEVMSYQKEGPKEEAPKEKVSKDPEEHTTGAGTEQAGTGDAEGEVPPRKDVADKMVKPKNYTEQDEVAAGGEAEEEKDEEGEEELDVDKKMEEAVPLKVIAQKQKDFDFDNDAVSEAFELFKEQIEDDEE